jgi:hypothetical protein
MILKVNDNNKKKATNKWVNKPKKKHIQNTNHKKDKP